MPCHELDSAAWCAERFDEDERYPFGPHDYEADQAEERHAYHCYGFEMLDTDQDTPFSPPSFLLSN